jgi:hypothetical protein
MRLFGYKFVKFLEIVANYLYKICLFSPKNTLYQLLKYKFKQALNRLKNIGFKFLVN